MDVRSFLAEALRLLLTLLGRGGSRTSPPLHRAERAEDPPVPRALVPAAETRAPSPAAETHALRLDAASVLVISEPRPLPALPAGPTGGSAPPPDPVTVVILPTTAGPARPGTPYAGNGGAGRTMADPSGAARSGNGPAAARGPRPWWRPAGLPEAPSDGRRGSWDGGREPWFTGRWAR